MKQYLSITALICAGLFSGCTLAPTTTPDKQKTVLITKNLTPPTSLTLQADYVSMGIDWVPSYNDPNIKGYEISRSLQSDTNFTVIAKLDNPFIGHYNDTELAQNTLYYYRVSAYAEGGVVSNFCAKEGKTLPLFDAITGAKARSELPRTVKLVWTPHPYPSVKEYIILKNNPLKGSTWEEIAKVNGRLANEFVDSNLEDEREYSYRVIAQSFDKAQSLPTEVLTAKTKKLPLEIKTLSATTDKPKAIEISFTYTGDVAITHYKIYRSDSAEGRYEPIAQIETNTTSYLDTFQTDGTVKFYKVVGVDTFGLEGIMQKTPIMGATRYKPEKPIIVSNEIVNGKVIIKWSSPDKKAIRYSVIKQEKTGLFTWEESVVNNVTGESLEETIKPSVEYRFTIRAIDDKEVVSEPSEPAHVELKLPKSGQ